MGVTADRSCSEVFIVSIGVSPMRHSEAAPEAAAVFTPTWRWHTVTAWRPTVTGSEVAACMGRYGNVRSPTTLGRRQRPFEVRARVRG